MAFCFSAFEGRPFFFLGVSATCVIVSAGAVKKLTDDRTDGRGMTGAEGLGRVTAEDALGGSFIDGGDFITIALLTEGKTDILSK